ncbi:MAG: hypothetical protein JO057_17775 [Chloroflexi bacterium]|nr:hypothetical protein [Chloroflexota bacterium]
MQHDEFMVEVTGDTRLSQILDSVPGALDYIVALKPHDFERLRNATLRHYMSPRISLRRVAAIAGVSEQRLVDDLTLLANGQTPEAPQSVTAASELRTVPDWLQGVDPTTIQWVDVVPIDAVGGDPFPPISLAVRQLEPGGVLGIRHRWEPQPLYDIWVKMNLEWFAQPVGDSEWYIFVHRPAGVAAYPTRDVVGVEVANLPGAEVLPRLQVLAEQLARGQTLEATGLTDVQLAELQPELSRQLGAGYTVVQSQSAAGKRVLRIAHQP